MVEVNLNVLMYIKCATVFFVFSIQFIIVLLSYYSIIQYFQFSLSSYYQILNSAEAMITLRNYSKFLTIIFCAVEPATNEYIWS